MGIDRWVDSCAKDYICGTIPIIFAPDTTVDILCVVSML